MTAGSYETAGTRGVDKMEDRHIVAKHAGGGEGGPMLLGVFDGHRGHEAAEFMAEHLESQLGLAWASCSGPGEALRTAFLAVDSSFVQQQVPVAAVHHPLCPTAAVNPSGPRSRHSAVFFFCSSVLKVIHSVASLPLLQSPALSLSLRKPTRKALAWCL